MTFRAPNGISSVDAFTALYTQTCTDEVQRHSMTATVDHLDQLPGSPWNAIQIFKKYCPDGYCDYVRNYPMKVDFRRFPEIDTTKYDGMYGAGTAEKVIRSWQKFPEARDQNYDLSCHPCAFFTSYWKEKTPLHQRKDLEDMFKRCQGLEEAKKRFEEQAKKSQHSSLFGNYSHPPFFK